MCNCPTCKQIRADHPDHPTLTQAAAIIFPYSEGIRTAAAARFLWDHGWRQIPSGDPENPPRYTPSHRAVNLPARTV